jgi:hypothetical protein
MQNISRKVLVVLLLVLSVLVIGVGAYVVYQIQNTQAPTPSSASGFGVTATRELYPEAERVFRVMGCDNLFSEAVIDTYAPVDFAELRALDMTVESTFDTPLNPLNCLVELSTDETLFISLHTYELKSLIDATKEELYERIKAKNLAEVISQGNYFGSEYFFGIDKSNNENCRSNLFNQQNEFEYLTIQYIGFDDCAEISGLNGTINYVISRVVDEAMIQINKTLTITD